MTGAQEKFLRYLALTHPAPSLLEVERAEGIYLYTPSGERYIDFNSGIGPVALGHSHPAIRRAVHAQIDRYAHTMVWGEYVQSPQVAYAEALVSHLPEGLDTVYFTNSGTEAVEGAIKLARKYTGRCEIVAARSAYHGSTLGAMSLRSDIEYKQHFMPLLPGVRHLRFNAVEEVERITTRTACVVLETIQSEAGVLLPDVTFLQAIRRRCDEVGALLVLDEIQVGMGRTGRLWAFEHYGIAPDVLVLAKALGGGLPLGAFIASRKIMSALWERPTHGHLTTFGGNPVSCAAGKAALDIICREDFLRDVERKGHRIASWLKRAERVREIRHIGLMIGVDLGDAHRTQAVIKELFARHIIVDYLLFHTTTFRIAPPLTVTEEEIDEAMAVVVEVLSTVGAGGN